MSVKHKLAEPSVRIVNAAWAVIMADPSRDPAIRAIAATAAVNVAMVSYYFESKEGLLAAMFRTHVEPIQRERLCSLDHAEQQMGVTLERVLDAWLEPILRQGKTHQRFAALSRMMRLHHGALYARIFAEAFDADNRRFIEVLAALLPSIPVAVITWRLYATAAAMMLAFDPFAVQNLSGMTSEFLPSDGEMWRLRAYAIAGFGAPAPASTSEATQCEMLPRSTFLKFAP